MVYSPWDQLGNGLGGALQGLGAQRNAQNQLESYARQQQEYGRRDCQPIVYQNAANTANTFTDFDGKASLQNLLTNRSGIPYWTSVESTPTKPPFPRNITDRDPWFTDACYAVWDWFLDLFYL